MGSSKSVETFDVVVKGYAEQNKLADCPFCQRVLITMQVKNIPYDLTLVDLGNKPAWLEQVSGGKVPILRSPPRNLVMPDSDVIVEYLEKEFPEPSMVSQAPASLCAKLFPAFTALLKTAAGSAEEAAGRQRIDEELAALEEYLARPGHGPFIGGAKLDAKDAAVAPKVYHAHIALANLKGFTCCSATKNPHVHRYLAALGETAAWVATLPQDGEKEVIEHWRAKM